MPALDRALPFTDRPEGAVPVGHYLHLDVTPAREIALAEHGRIAEGRLRLAPRGSHLLIQLSQRVHDPHPATTTAGRCLDQHGQLLLGNGGGVKFGEYRHPGGGHHLLGLDLRTHRLDRGGRRSDPDQPGVVDGTDETGVLREEPVAGMHRAGTGRAGRVDDLRAVGIAVDADAGIGFGHMRTMGVGVGVDRDGADTKTAAGREDAAGDLAAVGHQNTGDHGSPTS